MINNKIRYELIKTEIAKLFEDYNVNEIPIDVFEIASKMNIKITKFSQLSYEKRIILNTIFHHPDSFVTFDKLKQQFIIYLNDKTILSRQKFSIAHEIIHIILEHDCQTFLNEKEANFGASYLLVPTSLALIAPQLFLDNENILIDEIFEVSKELSINITKQINNRLNLSYNLKDYEKTINNLLKDTFLKKISKYSYIFKGYIRNIRNKKSILNY